MVRVAQFAVVDVSARLVKPWRAPCIDFEGPSPEPTRAAVPGTAYSTAYGGNRVRASASSAAGVQSSNASRQERARGQRSASAHGAPGAAPPRQQLMSYGSGVPRSPDARDPTCSTAREADALHSARLPLQSRLMVRPRSHCACVSLCPTPNAMRRCLRPARGSARAHGGLVGIAIGKLAWPQLQSRIGFAQRKSHRRLASACETFAHASSLLAVTHRCRAGHVHGTG